MDRPSLNALRAFEAVARLGSFTRAAEELYVTQGAVSHQVRRLERELDLRLFERAHRSISLTPAGRRLSLAATEAFQRLDTAIESLTRRSPDSVLNVSVPLSFATRFLVPRLEGFRRLHPELDVRISATDRRVDPVREGIDVCIRFAKRVDGAGLATTLLVAEDVFPVCNPVLLREPGTWETPADLAGQVLLHVQPRGTEPDLPDPELPDPDLPDWGKWLRVAGGDPALAREGPRFSHAGLALSAALAGQGVALGRTTLVADDLAAGRLVRPFVPSFRSRLAYWILTPAGERTRAKTRPFRVWLEAEVAACASGS